MSSPTTAGSIPTAASAPAASPRPPSTSSSPGASLTLRQIHKMDDDGTQIPILTSRTDLPAAEVCWRLGGRWRQENYFKYAREHFALDALDSYQDTADDPGRMVPNPAKKTTTKTVEGAKAAVSDAETVSPRRSATPPTEPANPAPADEPTSTAPPRKHSTTPGPTSRQPATPAPRPRATSPCAPSGPKPGSWTRNANC